MNLLVSVSLFIRFLSVQCAPQKYKLRYINNTRPGQPYTDELPCYDKDLNKPTPGAGTMCINLARHHIVPWNVLQNFWNLIITNNDHLKSGLDSVWRQYKDQYQNPKTKITYNADVIALVEGIQAGNIVNDNNGLTHPGFNDFIEFFAWNPANLFIGPTGDIRSDDPGDEFEVHCNTIIGKSKYGYLSKTYQYMSIYAVTDTVSVVKNNMRQFALAMNQVYNPYPLKKNNWVRKKDKYHILVTTTRIF